MSTLYFSMPTYRTRDVAEAAPSCKTRALLLCVKRALRRKVELLLYQNIKKRAPLLCVKRALQLNHKKADRQPRAI